ncbi:MAG: 2-hydroxyacyl-CoA dehydratase [Proteobacteria bacterium]|jgi:benzoyl-CoA reductase subunit C|nr:2-hydroxyacyl-CoA dehydratase [Pseudomonadota bacterium]
MAKKDPAAALLQQARRLARRHTNDRVDAWKEQGKPVIGYFCPYVPSEIILATGALPLRFRGSGSDDSSLGDAYMSSRLCTYVRHVVSLALDDQFDFLDGQISLNTCDHVRRATDTLQAKTSIGFHGFLSVPRSPREDLFPYFLNELKKLFVGLSQYLGVEAGNDELRQAIRTMNDVRRRLVHIDSLRMKDRPKLSGADALAIHVAARSLPPEEFVQYADELIKALEAREGLAALRGRLVVIGPELDSPAYLDAIESQGAIIVADRLCFGSRALPHHIDADAPDPLEAIARATFFRTPCARMIGDFPTRWDALVQTVSDARADGVVFPRLMFCDPWGADVYNMGHRIKKDALFPVLFLTREYGIVASGQVKTRVQAFLERIEIAKARAKKGES